MPSARRAFGKRVSIAIPPELQDEEVLFGYLGMSPAGLKKIWWYCGRMYHEFDIAKRSGKIRTTTAPDRRLKMIQQKIALLLEQLYRVRNPVHGFVPQRSVETNAESNGRRREEVSQIKIDHEATTTEKRTIGLLRSLGLSKRVAEVVARLCCHMGRKSG